MATPCCPAPVSAITRFLPIRKVKQALADRVVDLVRAGVVEVFPLEIDAGPAALPREPLGKVQRAGPADKRFEQPLEFGLKRRVVPGLLVLPRQLLERVHQRFGDKAAAELAKSALGVGHLRRGTGKAGGKPRRVACVTDPDRGTIAKSEADSMESEHSPPSDRFENAPAVPRTRDLENKKREGRCTEPSRRSIS